MNTLSPETQVRAPFRVVPTGSIDTDVYEPEINDSEIPSDAWGALAWLGRSNVSHANVMNNIYTCQFDGASFWMVTGADSSSLRENLDGTKWEHFRLFNRYPPFASGEFAKLSQEHTTSSLAEPDMILEFKVSSDRWQGLKASIDRWSHLPLDWDGDDGIAPPRQCISAARRMLNIFAKANLPPPAGYVAGDGEIGFRWQTDKGFASLSLLDDGTALAFCRIIGQSTKPFRSEAKSDKLDLYSFIEAVAQIS